MKKMQVLVKNVPKPMYDTVVEIADEEGLKMTKIHLIIYQLGFEEAKKKYGIS